METLLDVLNSDAVLSAIAAVATAIYGLTKAASWLAICRSERYQKALEALEAGVELTYRTYVRSIKESREDGKLTKEEIRQAQLRAKTAAIEYAKSDGIDVVKELGGEYIDLLISKLVKRMKG